MGPFAGKHVLLVPSVTLAIDDRAQHVDQAVRLGVGVAVPNWQAAAAAMLVAVSPYHWNHWPVLPAYDE